MSFVDLIGFIISIFAIIFLFFRNWRDATQRRNQPEEEENLDVEDEELREFLRSLEGETERQKAPLPPPPSPPKKVQKSPPPKQTQQQGPQQQQPYTSLRERQLESELEDYRLKSRLEEHRLQSRLQKRKIQTALTQEYSIVQHIGENRVPRIVLIMQQLPSLQHMVVYQEVLGPPKCLRKWQE